MNHWLTRGQAFFGFTAMYWLIKLASPFTLLVLSLTSLFIAPLVVPTRGRAVAHDARVRAEELANPVVDDGKALANGIEAEAAAQFSKTDDFALDTERRIGDIAHSGMQTGVDQEYLGINAIGKAPGTLNSGLLGDLNL